MKLNVYLNFQGNTEEAFNYYKQIFGGEFLALQKFKDVPDLPGKENMSEEDLNKVMHVALMIGDDMLMGTDALDSMGQKLTVGSNVNLSLHPDSRAEADRLFGELRDGGSVEMEMADVFWGDYFGACTDKFGIHWMINCDKK